MTPGPQTIEARRRNALSRLAGDRRGVAAVEFALIAPVMIVMWVGLITLAEAIMVQQRASHMTFAVGDLVAAQTSLNSGYVTNAMAAGALILQPMQATYSQRVSEVIEQLNANDTVVWSCANGSYTAYTQNQVIFVPYNAQNAYGPGTNVIQSEATVVFNSPLIGSFLPNGFSFSYYNWFFPRSGSAIAAPSSC